MKKRIMLILLSLLLAGCTTGKAPQTGESPSEPAGTAETKIESGIEEPGESQNAEGGEIGSPENAEGQEAGDAQPNSDPSGQKQEQSDAQESGETGELKSLLDKLENFGDREVYERLYALRCAPENPIKPEGRWNRTNVSSGFWGTFDITQDDGESFHVEGEFGYYSHSGYFNETAYYITDRLAIVKYGSDEEDSGPAQYVAFRFEGECAEVLVTGASVLLGFGANVSMDGEYTQGDPVYTNAGILEELFTEQNLEDLKALIPEEYYTDYFLFSTREGCPVKSEATLPDGREGWCVECVLPTMGGYGYTLYFTEDGYYSITFENGYVFETSSFDEEDTGEE